MPWPSFEQLYRFLRRRLALPIIRSSGRPTRRWTARRGWRRAAWASLELGNW